MEEEMSLTYIRHVLQTRTRTFFYNGVVFLSVFKTSKWTSLSHLLNSGKISKENGFLFKFRKNFQRGVILLLRNSTLYNSMA